MLNQRQKLNSREDRIISEFGAEWEKNATNNFTELELIATSEERDRTHLLMNRLKSIYPHLNFAIEYARREDEPGIYSDERDYVIIQGWIS